MNKVILVGRLTKDPDVRYSNTEKGEQMAIARYTLAVDRRNVRKGDNQQSADFISCVAFGKNGEFTEKYLRQGTKIVITGHIQTGSYLNKDGNNVYTTDVVVEEQEFCEKMGSVESEPPKSSEDDGFMNIPEGIEEDLPFK